MFGPVVLGVAALWRAAESGDCGGQLWQVVVDGGLDDRVVGVEIAVCEVVAHA